MAIAQNQSALAADYSQIRSDLLVLLNSGNKTVTMREVSQGDTILASDLNNIETDYDTALTYYNSTHCSGRNGSYDASIKSTQRTNYGSNYSQAQYSGRRQAFYQTVRGNTGGSCEQGAAG